MRSMHKASSEASCTVTTSAGNVWLRKGLRADITEGAIPSCHSSVFLRKSLELDLLLLFLEELEEEEEALVLAELEAPAALEGVPCLLEPLLLLVPAAPPVDSSSTGR